MSCDIKTDTVNPPENGTATPGLDFQHAPAAPAGTAVRTLRDAGAAAPAFAHYHKSLPHNNDGDVDPPAFGKLLKALDTHLPKDFADIQLADPDGSRALVDPQTGLAVETETIAPWRFKLPPPPKWDSEAAAAEMIELYWMALLRDVPFAEWDTNPDVQAAAAELQPLGLYLDRADPTNVAFKNSSVVFPGGFGPGQIFRGGELSKQDAPERRGPYLSQFLIRDIPFGSLVTSARQKTVYGGTDYMTDWDTWLKVQRGLGNGPNVPNPDSDRRYICTMRDLAHYVHVDQLYEAYLNAALLLMESKANGGYEIRLSPGNPYGKTMDIIGCGIIPNTATSNYPAEIGFGTFGGPHVLSLVTEVATRALKAVWYQKWIGHLRLRPEAYGGLVHRALRTGGGSPAAFTGFPAPIKTKLQNSEAVKRIFAKYGTYLLPMAFPEGSPPIPRMVPGMPRSPAPASLF